MSQSSSGAYIIDEEFNIVGFNETAKNLYPQLKMNSKCYNALMGLDSPCEVCPIVNDVQGPRTYIDPLRHIQETVDAVEMPLPNNKTGHALVFSTIENDAKIVESLPKTNEELRLLSIVKSFTDDYFDVYVYTVSSKTITPIRMKERARGVYEGLEQKLDYNTLIYSYCVNNIYEEDQDNFLKRTKIDYVQEQLTNRESFKIHYRILRNQELHYFYLKIARVGDADSFDNIVYGFTCEDEDVQTKQKFDELNQEVLALEKDSITNLYTKEAFYRYSTHIVEKNPNQKFDVILLKVANLIDINHQFGRSKGDYVLKIIAQELQTYIQENSVISYMGDGRYISITKQKSEEKIIADMHDFVQKISSKTNIKIIVLKWAIFKDYESTKSLEQTMDMLKYALNSIRYEVGRQYVVFDQRIMDQFTREKQIEYTFLDSIRNGEIDVWLQPQYDTTTHRIIGAEALSRWNKIDGSSISPCEFIPVLERSDKISMLDSYIFEQVCKIQKELSKTGKNIPISVNLSGASLYKDNIAHDFYTITKQYNVNPRWIPIEITESTAVRASTIKEFSEELRVYGFKIQMDDFGSGYSSLASLQATTFSVIKIDKSLVDLIGSKSGESLLTHTIAYAKETGIQVIAEGVEEKKQLDFLQSIGCDYIQGFYFSKAVSKFQFMKMIKEDIQTLEADINL